MSKLTIIGVIVLMSISLLGMVGLQLYWISDAIQVKQEQFDRSVHEALARVVEKLETQEAVTAVANGMATLQQPSPAPEPVMELQAPAAVSFTSNQEPAAPEQIRPQNPPTPKNPPAQPGIAVKENKQARYTFSRAKNNPVYLNPGMPNFQVEFQALDSAMQQLLTAGMRMPALQAEHFKQMAAWQAQADSMHARAYRLSQNDALRIHRLPESTVRYTRQVNGRTLHFSADTLQFIALHLDSLRRSNFIDRAINAAEIASINVLKDSVFIYKKAHSAQKRLSEAMAAEPVTIVAGDKFSVRSIKRPEEPRPIQHKVTANPAHTKSKTTRAIPEKTEQRKATHLTAASTPDPAKIEAKKEKLNNVVEKMVVEFVAKEVPLEKRLNLEEIKPLLQTELQDKGIALDFGYWVLSGEQDTVMASPLPASGVSTFATYKASLFPNDIFDKSDYLAVYFPDSRAYAIRSLWMMLGFSALFTLIMVATFGTTIHIIFRQKKLSEMKNDFINNMTHEFKTPIATISLAADAIANPKVYARPEKVQYYTGIIRQENKRMNAQVENVLQIARLEKNDYQMNLARTDLHALVRKAIESVYLQVAEREGTITTDLHATSPDIELDEVHFYNVICNLLDNANKYSPDRPSIRIQTYNTTGGVVLAVEDKGMGMTRDAQLRVFDKFYRVPTGNLHNVKGFGLGLSYVKAIVKAHNGTIKLQSEPGKGARFEILLPASA